jgi:hypothetical protein
VGNGSLPGSALAPIGNGYYLERSAAAAFNAMAAAAQKRWGRPIRVISAYRTLDKQWYFWNLYRSGRGNLAAYPGTSNHGWGLAIDCASTWDRWAIDQIGRAFGWAKVWSDAPSEWWHIKYNAGVWHGHVAPPGPRVLRQGMSGNDVKEVQIYLVRGGFLKKAKPGQHPAIDGSFGAGTKAAVQHFQRDNHMTADGVVGPATIAALRKKYKNWP